MNVAEETLGFRRASLSLALSLLMSAFALPIPPACLTTHLHRPTERSPTMWQLNQAPSRVKSPVHGPDQRLDFIEDRFGLGRVLRTLNLLAQVSLVQASSLA